MWWTMFGLLCGNDFHLVVSREVCIKPGHYSWHISRITGIILIKLSWSMVRTWLSELSLTWCSQLISSPKNLISLHYSLPHHQKTDLGLYLMKMKLASEIVTCTTFYHFTFSFSMNIYQSIMLGSCFPSSYLFHPRISIQWSQDHPLCCPGILTSICAPPSCSWGLEEAFANVRTSNKP
jgi:hypothetical protein